MKNLSLAIAMFMVSCAPTFKLNQRISEINICPKFSESENALIKDSYLKELERIRESNSDFIKNINCSDSLLPKLNISFEGTRLSDSQDKTKATLISVAGIALPFFLISIQSSFWVTFIYLPTNSTQYNLDFDDKYEKENKLYTRNAGTLTFSNDVNSNMKKQGKVFNKNLNQVIKNIKKESKKDGK